MRHHDGLETVMWGMCHLFTRPESIGPEQGLGLRREPDNTHSLPLA
jgi:hypothetical protein